ncbi:hypothetical protein EON65_31120 [archaeon]|nr:MAG: hypothetical protein EON65_31120 [archaeon]
MKRHGSRHGEVCNKFNLSLDKPPSLAPPILSSSLPLPPKSLNQTPSSLSYDSVRTMLEALISFLPSEGAGAIGALDWSVSERQRLAREVRCICNMDMVVDYAACLLSSFQYSIVSLMLRVYPTCS